jgi:hypothetical protein
MNTIKVAPPPTATIDIRRSHERFHTKIDWLDAFHSFSFGQHYDPKNTHHGFLLVSNDDIIKAGRGFMTHPHQDMEIVTWVLDGELEHKDSLGNTGIIYPGLAQRMSAGTGIRHSEMNPSQVKEVHLVQMWVVPDQKRITPSYEQQDINSQLEKGGLVPIASGRKHQSAISIRQAGAVLWGGRLKPGELVQIPGAPYIHVFMAKGRAELEGVGTLETGDTVRLTHTSLQPLKADAESGAEVLIWEMTDSLGESV